METFNNDDVLDVLTGMVSERIKRPFYQACNREGIDISVDECLVLNCLSVQDKVSQLTLCNHINKDKPAMTRLLDRMENKRLVKRTMDEADKRKNRVSITSNGMQVCNRVNELVTGIINNAMQNIDESQFMVFRNVHRLMLNNLSLVK